MTNNIHKFYCSMKRLFFFLCLAVLLTACTDSEKQLRKRATELCRYIPDHQLLEKSRDYMTDDFYNVLDTMFNHLPETEEVAHEWLYYFVTGNGGTIADYEVVGVEKTDPTHAVATVNVRQQWEDGSFDPSTDIETHRLYMEKVKGEWLMSDFDEHKQDCIRSIEISRQEQAVRDAIADYLVREVGSHYLQGELCVPVVIIVAGEEPRENTQEAQDNPQETMDNTQASQSDDADTEIKEAERANDSCENNPQARILLDSWIFWYNLEGDTLKTVSGGNHSGCMTIIEEGGKLCVTSFEQTTDGAGYLPSAKRIFGDYYDIYHNIHSHPDVSEAVRRLQLIDYLRRHNLNARYYQDYGWPAVSL